MARQKKKRRKKRKKKKRRRRSAARPLLRVKAARGLYLRMPIVAEFGLGYLDGEHTLRVRDGIAALSLRLEPTLRYRKRLLILRLPLEYRGRESLSKLVPERMLRAGLELTSRPLSWLELGLGGEAGRIFRPGWPDQYQPEADQWGHASGELLTSDRYSYDFAEGQGFVRGLLPAALALKLYGGYRWIRFDKDPEYDEILEPTHLVPGDRGRVRGGLKLSGKAWKKRWRYGLDARVDWLAFEHAYARDAGTGKTHAGPGGPPPNPLQEFVRTRFEASSSLWALPSRLRLSLAIRYTRSEDLFQDYYTWQQVGATLGLRVRPARTVTLDLGYRGAYAWYTRSGYQEGTSHPPLDDGGAVRTSMSHAAAARLGYRPHAGRLELFLDGSFSGYWTNFPDYVPGVYPRSSQYSIEWDYTNVVFVSGFRLDL